MENTIKYKQYGEFYPTYLYIKQHTITGKLYFGKTVHHPDRYYGSGSHWKQHIKKHGKEYVINLWYQLYDNVFDLVADALSMSYAFDIVNNNSWLNQMLETGLDGASPGELHHMKSRTGENHPLYGKVGPMRGKKLSAHQIEKACKNRTSRKGKNWTPNQREKMDEFYKNYTKPEYQLKKQSIAQQKKYSYTDGKIIYVNIGMKEFAKLMNLNYGSMAWYFRNNRKYKGFSRLQDGNK